MCGRSIPYNDFGWGMHRDGAVYAPTSCWVCTDVLLGMNRHRFRSVGCAKRQLEWANALERGKDTHCGPPSSVWPRFCRGERRRAHISCSGQDRLRAFGVHGRCVRMHRYGDAYAPPSCWVCADVVLGRHRRCIGYAPTSL